MRPLRQTVWTALFVAVLAIGVMLACAGQALAHAALIRAEPADGAVLPRAPAQVRLTFNEPVSPLVLRLVAPNGSVMALPRVASDGTALVVTLPEARGDGSYVLSWRVASEDGHPVGGTVLFSVGAPSSGPAPVEHVNSSVRTAIWLTRFILFVGLFIGVGGAAFGGLIAPLPRPAERLAQVAMLGGLVAASVSVWLQGLDALGAPWPAIIAGATWRTGYSTAYGTTAFLAIVALLLGLQSLRLRFQARAVLSGLALGTVGLALAASGHASAAAPRWLTGPAVFLHAGGVAFWLGSLVPLAFLLRSTESTEALARFSRFIRFAVAAIVASGIVLGAVQLGWPSPAWLSPYGAVLLAKLMLLAALFGLAAYNRFRLTAPALAGDGVAQGRMRRSLVAEIAVAVLILAAVALWRFTPPPRALAETAAAPAYLHIHTPSAMADLTVTPGRAGPVTASVVLQSGEFGPLAAKEVTLELANPALGIEPIQRQARLVGEGPWQTDSFAIPASGRWQVKIEVLVSDFDRVTLEGTLDIGR
ncbi:MAG: copper resistance domain protein [Xanthobacteraceae bacterium]|nr:copper resistance domain protein [Xanthobacteraceae bacterium]